MSVNYILDRVHRFKCPWLFIKNNSKAQQRQNIPQLMGCVWFAPDFKFGLKESSLLVWHLEFLFSNLILGPMNTAHELSDIMDLGEEEKALVNVELINSK